MLGNTAQGRGLGIRFQPNCSVVARFHEAAAGLQMCANEGHLQHGRVGAVEHLGTTEEFGCMCSSLPMCSPGQEANSSGPPLSWVGDYQGAAARTAPDVPIYLGTVQDTEQTSPFWLRSCPLRAATRMGKNCPDSEMLVPSSVSPSSTEHHVCQNFCLFLPLCRMCRRSVCQSSISVSEQHNPGWRNWLLLQEANHKPHLYPGEAH